MDPSTEKLCNILNRADLQKLDGATRNLRCNIWRRCGPCKTYAQNTRRFKFTLREDKHFNDTRFVEIFYIYGKSILHVVDELTSNQAARWLEILSADSFFHALHLCWIFVYFCPPDIISHDARKKFMAKSFKPNSDLIHIDTKAIPVESAN